MRSLWVLALLALLWAPPLGGLAQGADEEYVSIYNLIQKADALREAGQAMDAFARYQTARNSLLKFQKDYPDWNEKVISYRIGYVTARLTQLEPIVAAAPPPAVTPPPAVRIDTDQVAQLQGELTRLRSNNALLEAKLKEALSVQPSPVNVQELARAQQTIGQLLRERDLLLVTVEQQAARIRPLEAEVAAREEQILADIQRKLTRQVEINAILSEENETLRRQLGEQALATGTQPEVEQQLAQATIATLQATNASLRTEQRLLEARLNSLMLELGNARQSGGTIHQAEMERDQLRQQLAAAQMELSQLKLNASSDLQSQLAAAQARLAVYEAKTVPYTSEELALFKNQPLQAELTTQAGAGPTSQPVPAGTGSLVARAEQEHLAGQFEKAEKTYRQVLRQDPNNSYILSQLAAVQLETRQWTEAEKTLQRALTTRPNDPASLFLMGYLKFEQKDFDAALDALSRSAQLLPDKADTQYLLGRTLTEKGQRGPAEAAFRKAVQLDPRNGAAHHALAVVYATQDPPFTELAQWHYDKARRGGQARDQALERWLEQQKAAGPNR